MEVVGLDAALRGGPLWEYALKHAPRNPHPALLLTDLDPELHSDVIERLVWAALTDVQHVGKNGLRRPRNTIGGRITSPERYFAVTQRGGHGHPFFIFARALWGSAFRQGCDRSQIGMLPPRGVRINTTGDVGCVIVDRFDLTACRQCGPAHRGYVEPFMGRAPECPIIEIKAVYVDDCARQ